MADQLDIGRRSTYERLERLVDHGELETKKAGTNGHVWWRPQSLLPAQTATDHDWPTVAESLVDDVLDTADVGVFVLNEDFEVAWINDTLERYFGFNRERILGQDKRELVRDQITPMVDDGEQFAETVLATYEENTYAERFECHMTAGEDRDARWLEHRSKPITSGAYAGGRVELYYDITEQKQSERAHREERTRFESLIDAVEEYAIFMLDVDGCVRSWNSGARQTKGYAPNEVLGEHVSTFYTEEDQEADVPEANLAAAAEDGSIKDEGWRVRKDGSRFWASITITAIRDDDGDLEGYAKVTRDMTDRREREREIRREHDLLERILEISPTGIGVFDTDGEPRHVNRHFIEYLGLGGDGTERYALGDQPLLDEDGEVIPYPDRPAPRALATGETVTDQRVRVDSPDGETRWLSVNATPLPDETGVVITMADITQLEKQAQRLERQRDDLESELEDVFERVDDAFYAVDDKFRFTYVNDRAEELLGHDEASLLGQTVGEALSVADDDPVRDRFETAMATQTATSFERYSEPLGIWESVRLYPSESGLSVYFTDISERKKYEQKLKESNERLEQFAYIASHDLQEPLRMITSYLQLLEQRYSDALDEDGEEFLEFAVDGAERMREMIDALLEYSRVETQGDPFEPVDLDAVLEDVRRDLRLRLDETDAILSSESLPRVEGDPDQLRQVFQNLLSNALAYSGDEPPRVHIGAERRGSEWVISVEDEGIGIDSDAHERVFEVFQRLHSHEEHDGTGIGLALCKRIVERHGGEIWVDSEHGEGATFRFTLPAVSGGNT
ncbi:PAS domain S-box protein [Natrinema sp. 1APR25-10V2]|uniref:PAS domain S-box protein n=1 Tax=Natrinema sp. 1APR25-10V2 TaxID=2951081 RepID=UPI002876F035|nr:PAS domain S-box protein [Natrinema sp. 1APR25-10V2]MDS0474048.1 PAS domain S-box protein [Natrinema sp. 1APR25-10V2]